MGRVEGKVAIITGGARGIGRATCLLFAKEGAKVAVTDINDKGGAEVVSEIKKSGGTAQYYHVDVAREDEVKKAFSDIYKSFGKIDILANIAGIGSVVKPTHEITEAEWDVTMNIDAKGVFFCSKHAISYMLKGGGGSIVNISSVYGIVAGMDNPPPYPYHAAKGAVRLMTKSDAICYAKDKIRVNSIHPGWIWTPLLDEVSKTIPGGPEEFDRVFLPHIPLGHWGEAEDVAHGVLFLASDNAKFITGSELVIDGGYIAW